jgi:hypothetical protein
MELQIHTSEVKSMLEESLGHHDPRVREEAKLALSLMNRPPDVRPASYRR